MNWFNRKERPFRPFLAAAVLLVSTFAIACGGDDDDNGTATSPSGGTATSSTSTTNTGELRKVTFMLDWTPNTNHSGIYIAKANGWYEEAGLDVEIIEPGQNVVAQVVASGQAEFGISVAESLIPARAEGAPIVSIAAVIQHNTSSLMSLAEDAITTPKDLEGKTYGGFGGALETAIIEALVECDGGNPESIEYVEIGNVDFLIGMERDSYDFVWIFDAWDGVRSTEIEDKDVNFLRFSSYTNCIPDWYTPIIITSEGLIESDPELVRDFMTATTRGYEEAMENPDAAVDAILDAAPETNEELLRASAEFIKDKYVDEGRQWGLQDAEVWSEFEAFLREAGLTDTEVDTGEAFTNEFVE